MSWVCGFDGKIAPKGRMITALSSTRPAFVAARQIAYLIPLGLLHGKLVGPTPGTIKNAHALRTAVGPPLGDLGRAQPAQARGEPIDLGPASRCPCDLLGCGGDLLEKHAYIVQDRRIGRLPKLNRILNNPEA